MPLDDHEQAALVPMEGGKVLCLKCNKTLAHMGSAMRHFRSSHQQNQRVRCQICHKVFKNLNSKNTHVMRIHGVSATMMKNAIHLPSDM